MDAITYLAENWAILAVAVIAIVLGVIYAYRFVKLPPEQQLDKVQQWLLWAVVSAERELGGGTGELKLRSVYDLFVARFPWLAKLISFECFADMVDDALDEMETLLTENKDIHAFVTGGDVAC